MRLVRNDLLWEHCLARAQSPPDTLHILHDELVNRTDCALDNLWNEPVLQQFLWKISVVSIGSYLWITAWIIFWIAHCVNQFLVIAYGINLFLGIAYGVNLFLGIGVCRISAR